MSDQKQTPWQRWYEKNKHVLAERRSKRYASDPDYRKKCVERSRASRKVQRERNPPPPGAIISYAYAASMLGISVLTLSAWKKRGLFPDPEKFCGKYLFKPGQVALMKKLAKFFEDNGYHLTKKQREDLQVVVEWIRVNWE